MHQKIRNVNFRMPVFYLVKRECLVHYCCLWNCQCSLLSLIMIAEDINGEALNKFILNRLKVCFQIVAKFHMLLIIWKIRLRTCLSLLVGFLGGLMVKNPPVNAGGAGSIPALGRSLEEEMAIRSSILTRTIPWTEELQSLLSMGSQRAGHVWATEREHQFSSVA